MENQEKANVLNDLIRINNDRIEGYERAAEELKDQDNEMKAIFRNMAEESRGHKAELIRKVNSLGEEHAKDTTISGKAYRVWMDMKATFTGNDRKAIISSCEFGEDAAQKAYQEALSDSENLSPDVRQLITAQKQALKTSHDLIKHYRDRVANS